VSVDGTYGGCGKERNCKKHRKDRKACMEFLFPGIPKGHPASGAIVMNLVANFLGLGNAATPLGIKAMNELQKLNPTKTLPQMK